MRFATYFLSLIASLILFAIVSDALPVYRFERKPFRTLSKRKTNKNLVFSKRYDRDFSKTDQIVFHPATPTKRVKKRSEQQSYTLDQHASLLQASDSVKSNAPSVHKELSSKSVLTPDKYFQFDFECTANDESLCPKAKEAFESAGTRIAKVLKLYKPIKVLAKYNSFCKLTCEDQTLGRAGAASFWAMKNDDGREILYPQALTKQLSEDQLDYAQYDIVAEFNADKWKSLPEGVDKFWFKGDPKIRNQQYDFEYVVLHELLHGLGFISSWGVYFEDPSDPGSSLPILTPPKANDTPLPSDTQTFSPIIIFDRYIIDVTTKRSFMDFFDKLNSQFRNLNPKEGVRKSTDAYKAANDIYVSATTPKQLAFELSPLPSGESDNPDANLLYLETRYNPFQQGSSLSHVDYSFYARTPDALLRARAPNGTTLDYFNRFQEYWPYGAVGPLIVRALDRLGYDVSSVDEKVLSEASRLDLIRLGQESGDSGSSRKGVPIAMVAGFIATMVMNFI